MTRNCVKTATIFESDSIPPIRALYLLGWLFLICAQSNVLSDWPSVDYHNILASVSRSSCCYAKACKWFSAKPLHLALRRSRWNSCTAASPFYVFGHTEAEERWKQRMNDIRWRADAFNLRVIVREEVKSYSLEKGKQLEVAGKLWIRERINKNHFTFWKAEVDWTNMSDVNCIA